MGVKRKEEFDLKDKKILNYLLIIISICFAMPSIVFLVNNKTVLNFDGELEFCFLLTKNINRLYQAGVFVLIMAGFLGIYYLIIKNRNIIFKNIKEVYKLIITISLIFVIVLPFWCSDVFYYLGIGRLSLPYNQNPYYTTMKSFLKNTNLDLKNDTVIKKASENFWANTTVVYGAFWTFLCSIISLLSFGNIDVGLFLFKIFNLIIHILNCHLLYKLSKNKIFPIIYGLNPFILIEGIANVHNDLVVIFFIFLALYFLIKKNNLLISIMSLSMATGIKYFAILFLPLFIIYYFRNEKIKTRLINCVKYGSLFLIFLIIPYLIYIKDINVFMGIYTQQNKIAKGLYLFISEYLKNPPNLVEIVKTTTFLIFAIVYICKCISLLFEKNIKFKTEMNILFLFIVYFIFLLITNFQPWYLIWLIPFLIWQKPQNIRLIINIQNCALMANVIFLIYSENYRYGVPFFVILVFGVLISIIINLLRTKR